MRPIMPTMMVKTPTNSAADPTSSPAFRIATLDRFTRDADSSTGLALENPDTPSTLSSFLIFSGWHRVSFDVLDLRTLGLRFLRTLRLSSPVEGDRLANERLEGGLID